MSELVEWYRVQLDEDERVAQAATEGSWAALDGGVMSLEDESWPVVSTETGRERADRVHIARHDPARVLREVAAKRAIVDAYERKVESMARYPNQGNANGVFSLAVVMQHLASAYADRPGYREEWKP